MPPFYKKLGLLMLLLLSASNTLAQPEPERTMWFSDIVIPAGHEVEEATCFFCSIRVEGKLGEATTQCGDIVVSGTITGSATAIAGGVKLHDGAQVQRDVVSVFGDIVLGPNAKIGGDAVASIGIISMGSGASVANGSVPITLPLVSMLPPRLRLVAVLWMMGIVISIPMAYLSLFILKQSRLDRLSESVKQRRWLTMILGTLTLGVFVVALEVGGNSIYDDWIELPTVVVMIALMAPGYTAIARRLGMRWRSGPKLALLLGTLALVSLQVVPIVGWLLSAVLMIFSLGSLFSLRSWAVAPKDRQTLSQAG